MAERVSSNLSPGGRGQRTQCAGEGYKKKILLRSKVSGLFVQNLRQAIKNAINVFENFVVPETDHTKSLSIEKCGSARVPARLRGVLTTIDFDDYPALETDKINDIRANWRLTTEFRAFKLAQPKSTQKLSLGVGHVASEFAGTTRRHEPKSIMALGMFTPSLTLPHQGGGHYCLPEGSA